jgi:predicted DNA-binding transcriptional regulator AlpA
VKLFATAVCAAMPTLDDLAADPTLATELPSGAVLALQARCLMVQTALMAALLAGAARTGEIPAESDRALKIDAAADRLGVSRDWLYRHAHQLPFTVRNGRLLRFSSHGIDRYIMSRQRR